MSVDATMPRLAAVVVEEIPSFPRIELRRQPRLPAIDWLRGVVMILMALDHSRDFFSRSPFAPEDLAHTSAPLFFTRLATHYCAPVFFLLAGAGGYLSISGANSVAEVSRFYWTRGLWLVFLNLTVVAYAWTFVWPFWFSGVLWALGCSMVAMALIVRLPVRWIAAGGAIMIGTHNLCDGSDLRPSGDFPAFGCCFTAMAWSGPNPGTNGFLCCSR